MCRVFDVSRSGYYAWKNRDSSDHRDPVIPEVKKIFWEHGRRYGSRRILDDLRDLGWRIGRRRIMNAMRRKGLRAIQPRPFVPRTTDSRHGQRMSPNLLLELKVTGPRQAIVSNITYIPLRSGKWAYLTVWQDLYSRRILGWQLSDKMTVELVITAIRQAMPGKGRYCPQRSWRPIRGHGISATHSRPWLPTKHEPGRRGLQQRPGGKLLVQIQGRTYGRWLIQGLSRSPDGNLSIH